MLTRREVLAALLLAPFLRRSNELEPLNITFQVVFDHSADGVLTLTRSSADAFDFTLKEEAGTFYWQNRLNDINTGG